MSSLKDFEERGLIPLASKKIKLETKTYSRWRSEKTHSRRSSSFDTSSNWSKTGKVREKFVGPPTLVLDNGAYTAKIGMSTDNEPKVIPNCMMKVKSERKRLFISNQIEECRDLSGLYYLLPCEKGYTMKWTVQKPVWDYIFSNICPVEEKPVVMTQPLFNFKAIQEITDEIFFEEYEIKSMFRTTAADLAKYEYINAVVGKNTPCVIVDSGFSFTTVIPYINGKKYYKAIRRINVGGKVLTNYLKDIISYRQLHVMDETYVINQVKEDTCYVSLDFKQDMKIAGLQRDQNTIIKNYVLPDFNNIRRGYVQEEGDNSDIAEGCQILRLNNERFTVPEILFYPSDIGMESMGVAETIVKCIKLCPLAEQAALAKNIVVIGGNVNFPGFKERVYADVRSYLPDHWPVNVYRPDNPTTFTWRGGKHLSEDPKIKSLMITKEQYEERGSAYTYERFSDWVRTQRSEDEKGSKATEVKPRGEGILNSNLFSRFDLFGKYEPEAEETSNSEENAENKGFLKETAAGSSKSGEANSSSDGVRDHREGYSDKDGGNSSYDSLAEHSEDAVESSTGRLNEKTKSTKAVGDAHNTDVDTSDYNHFEFYDFNMFDNSYV